MKTWLVSTAVLSALLGLGFGCKTTETVEDTYDFSIPEGKPSTIVNSRLKQLQEKVRDYPKRADLHFDIAALQFQKESFRDSAESLKEAIYLDPDQPKYHYHLGRVHLYMGELEEAEQAFRKAVELTPPGRYNGPHFTLGYTLSLLKKWKDARAQFEACVLIDPKDPMPYYFLGSIADLHQDREQTIRYMREYIERGGRQYYGRAKEILAHLGVTVDEKPRPEKPAASESPIPPTGKSK
ncbi:MAG: tetratricopeptide repeat protein [Planctomycetes bacterium]|nr:tetratricopeptide repeat protein [Planctomycetota bacterium]